MRRRGVAQVPRMLGSMLHQLMAHPHAATAKHSAAAAAAAARPRTGPARAEDGSMRNIRRWFASAMASANGAAAAACSAEGSSGKSPAAHVSGGGGQGMPVGARLLVMLEDVESFEPDALNDLVRRPHAPLPCLPSWERFRPTPPLAACLAPCVAPCRMPCCMSRAACRMARRLLGRLHCARRPDPGHEDGNLGTGAGAARGNQLASCGPGAQRHVDAPRGVHAAPAAPPVPPMHRPGPQTCLLACLLVLLV
jgi:hypothetical protein